MAYCSRNDCVEGKISVAFAGDKYPPDVECIECKLLEKIQQLRDGISYALTYEKSLPPTVTIRFRQLQKDTE